MNNPKCATCGAKMKGNGTTKAGTRRWRCPKCGASSVRRHDRSAKQLAAFLRWLFGKASAAELGTSRSTFWRRTSWVWSVWPIAPFTGEVHDVVFLDGIWLRRKAVVLIAVAGGHVVGWHLARSECAEAWAALMARIPAPAMAVCDGSPGFAKAARAAWPGTRVQRCVFHVAGQVKRCTTLRPRLEAGKELLGIANALLEAKDAESAAAWLLSYHAWRERWAAFLRESAFRDGKRVYVHERLRKARGALDRLVRDKTLFAFVEMGRERGGEWPSTNNAVESVNARLREMLRHHRGLPLLHRVKAIFWWCYMHTENPLPAAEVLRVMPTDEDVEGLFAAASGGSGRGSGAPDEYGKGIVWEEFHMPTRFRR